MNAGDDSKAYLRIALFGVIVILAMSVAGKLTIFKAVERVTTDLRFRVRRPLAVDPGISLVLVDSAAINRYGYPVPRKYYAVVANELCGNGASAVVIDRTFESRDPIDPIGGAILARVFEQRDNIVSAWHSPLIEGIQSIDAPIVPTQFAMPHRIDQIGISPYETSLLQEKVSLPYHEALQNVKWLGSITSGEKSGNRIEKIPLIVKHGSRIYPAISLLAVCVALKVNLADVVIRRGEIFIPTQNGVIAIPVDERGQIRINYLAGRSAFLKNTHSISTVYKSISSGDQIVPLESFRGHIVLIGNDDVMGADMYSTPFGRSLMPGVMIQAMVISDILQERFIYGAAWYYNLIILAASVFCMAYVQRFLPPRSEIICLSVLLICIWVGAAAYFQFRGVLMNVSQPTFGVIFVFAGISFRNYASERKKVSHIRQVFGKHVSQEVMDQLILETDGQVPMSEQEVSALFADISDHSNWARDLEPPQFAAELNECLEAMAQAVFENGGIISRFLGDGLLALYNAPIEQDSHVLRAIRTGIAIQEHISEVNAKRVIQGKRPIAVRVGINTGKAMAGTLGSKDRIEYTVIGDTINMAKRAETECEPGRVAITDDVVREVGELIQVEAIGRRSVKGRESGLMLYHVARIEGNV